MLGLCVVVLLAWTATVKACPDFDECAANRAPGLDFNSISPSNVAKFCTAARHGIGSCLTHNFGGSSYSRGLALKQCAENATGADRERIGRIARLYFFACVYNDIRDATKKECFDNCVDTKKPDDKCYYPTSCPPGQRAMKSSREAKKATPTLYQLPSLLAPLLVLPLLTN